MISSKVCIIKQPLNPALSTTFKSTRETALRKSKRPRKRKYWATFFEHDIRGKPVENSSSVCGKNKPKKCKLKQKKKNSRNQKAQPRENFRNFYNYCCCHCSCTLINKPTIEQSSAEHLHQILLNLPESTNILNTKRKHEHVSTLLFPSLVSCGKHRALHLSDSPQYAVNKFLPKISTNDVGVISARETHQIAEAQQQKNAKLRVAFGIPEYFVEGTSFDPDRNAKELITKSLALQDELQIQREIEKQRSRKYTFVRTPSPENKAESTRINKEKRKKKKKHGSMSPNSVGRKEKRKKSRKHKKSRSKTKNQKKTTDIPTDKAEDNGNIGVSDNSEGLTHHRKKKKRERKTKNKKHQPSEDSHTNSPHTKCKGTIDGKRCEGERLSRLDEHRKRTSKKDNMLHIGEKRRSSFNNLGRHSDSSDTDHSVNTKRPRMLEVFAEKVTNKHSVSKRKSAYAKNIQSPSNRVKENKHTREKLNDRRNSSQSYLRKRNKCSRSRTRSRSPTDKRSSNTHSNLQKSSSSKERTTPKSRLHKKNFTTAQYLLSENCQELNNQKTSEEISNSPPNRINIRTSDFRRFNRNKNSTSKSPPIHTSLISESKIRSRSRDKFTFPQNYRGCSLYHTSSENRTYDNRIRSSSKSPQHNSRRWASEKEQLMQRGKTLTSMRGSDKIKESVDKTKSKLESSSSLENTFQSSNVKTLRSEEECPQFSMQKNTLQNDTAAFQDILQKPCSSSERKKHSLKSSNENIEKNYQHFTCMKADRASNTDSKNINEYNNRLTQKSTVEKRKTRSLSTSSESSDLSYSPARRDPERYRAILDEIKKENKIRLEKIASPKRATHGSNRSRSKEHKHSTQLQQPVVRLYSPNESDANDSGNEQRNANEGKFFDALVNEKKTDFKNCSDKEMEMLEALKSEIAAKAKEKIKYIEKMATEINESQQVASISLALNDSSLVEAIVAKVADAASTTVVATAVTSERQLRSRSRSKNKCSRSDSKSSYSSSRSRDANSSRSHGSSSSSSEYSRSSYSRSSSVSSSDNSKSRSHSGARSPSIPRRRGSPSFLDRRRITSEPKYRR